MTFYHSFSYPSETCNSPGCFFESFFTNFHFGKIYIICFSVIGAILAGLDVLRLVFCGPGMPAGLRRKRYKPGCVLSERLERDVKLVCSVLVVEFFILLIVAIITDRKELMLPWLCMQSCMIVGELIAFLFRVSEGFPILVNGWVIICASFAIFNWLQVFNEIRRDNNCLCGYSNICGHKM